MIIAGFRDGAAYLGTSDLYGTMYEDTFIATGLGAHMALPLLRQEWTAEMGEAEARALLTKCMQVLFYRDTRACSTIQIGKVDATGASISAPTKLETCQSPGSYLVRYLLTMKLALTTLRAQAPAGRPWLLLPPPLPSAALPNLLITREGP